MATPELPPDLMTPLADSGDDSLKALHVILSAWEEGAETGIAPEFMAYAALYTALTDLVSSYGEAHVAKLMDGLAERVKTGEFTLYRTRN
ncbi:MAG: hypothetical protein RL291_98 [Pseudomonadota bacterium]|jgi:hypothetical protein